MNYIVFDTETINIDTPFCYEVGYIIYNEEGEILKARDFLVEEVFKNNELFRTAYFYNRKENYLTLLAHDKINLASIHSITLTMISDMAIYNVNNAYAYNSSFDEKVFNFNCEYFNSRNPFEEIKVFDIRGYVHKCLAFTSEYKKFCDDNKYYTESGNYSTTAETVFRFLHKNIDFSEEHMALSDSIIENEILKYCINKGCIWNENYTIYKSIPRTKQVSVFIDDKEIIITNAKSVKYNCQSSKVVIK